MSKLSQVKTENWQAFRRVARFYERELRRIRDAKACSAGQLRWLADRALQNKPKPVRGFYSL